MPDTIENICADLPVRYGKTVWKVSMALVGLIAFMSFISIFTSCGVDSVQAVAVCTVSGLLGAGVVGCVIMLGRRNDGAWIARWTSRQWLIGVLALALLLRLACVILVPYFPCLDFMVYHQAGITMSQIWSLGIPDGSYRCFFPPGQVFSLGVMYSLFGPDVLAGQMLNVLYSTASVAGIWYISRQWFGDHVARVAALIVALLPSMIYGCLLLGAEVPEVFWLVAALCIYVRFVDGAEARRPIRWALLCGLVIGVGALIRPQFVLLALPIGLHMALSRPGHGRTVAAAGAMLFGSLLAVTPWTIRNYCVTGGFVFISSNGGGMIWSANNDNANGGYNDAAWKKLYASSPDDISLNRQGMAWGLDWIKNNPGRFVSLWPRKFVVFWWSDFEIPWWTLEKPVIQLPETPDALRQAPLYMDSRCAAILGLSDAEVRAIGEGNMSDATARHIATLGDFGVPKPARQFAVGSASGFYAACMMAAAVALWRSRRRLAASRGWMVIIFMALYFTSLHLVFESQGKYHFMMVPLLCILSAVAALPRSKITATTQSANDRAADAQTCEHIET